MATALPKEELRAILVTLSGLPASRVIWDGEPKGYAGPTNTGKTGHIVLDLIATRRTGIDQETREYGVDVDGVPHTRITSTGQRVRTVSVRAENYDSEEGYDLLESIRLGLDQDDIGEALNAAGLALNGTEDVVNIGGAAGNRAVSFASIDVLLNQCVSRERLVPESSGDTWIAEVETEGTDELEPAGITDVGPVP